jgi:tRNA nucleotidyltransferase/poly(A) polymerase
VGAHFGVVLVRDGCAQVEVATFRSDHAYSDGRHPGHVVFETSPGQDVLRRDFTINALLMDPDSGKMTDMVGGRVDLDSGVIRAIGDPKSDFAKTICACCGRCDLPRVSVLRSRRKRWLPFSACTG